MGGQRCDWPHDCGPDSAHHPQLLSLGLGLCAGAALGAQHLAPRQPLVGALEALHLAGAARRGLVQQLSVFSAANLHTHQRDFGRIQHARVHVAGGRVVLQANRAQAANDGGSAVHPRCDGGAVSW